MLLKQMTLGLYSLQCRHQSQHKKSLSNYKKLKIVHLCCEAISDIYKEMYMIFVCFSETSCA